MGRYLVVAHQTAASPELLNKVRELISADSAAEFVLLVPATPPRHLLAHTEGEAQHVARQVADSARAHLEEAGATVGRAEVGDEAPLLAIEDELRDHPARYEAIIVSTLPLGLSRWLGLDLPHQVEKKFGLPVIHVVSQASS